jgi:hypothetical protein
LGKELLFVILGNQFFVEYEKELSFVILGEDKVSASLLCFVGYEKEFHCL